MALRVVFLEAGSDGAGEGGMNSQIPSQSLVFALPDCHHLEDETLDHCQPSWPCSYLATLVMQ